jgi:hypothetical protein
MTRPLSPMAAPKRSSRPSGPEAIRELRNALSEWHGLITAEREQAHEAAKANAASDAATG